MLGYVTSQINYNNDVTMQTQAEMLLLLRSTDSLLNLTGREQIASHNEIITTLENHIDTIQKALSLEHSNLLHELAIFNSTKNAEHKTLLREMLALNHTAVKALNRSALIR